MEILKDFVFDIQRFAAVSIKDLEAGTTYYSQDGVALDDEAAYEAADNAVKIVTTDNEGLSNAITVKGTITDGILDASGAVISGVTGGANVYFAFGSGNLAKGVTVTTADGVGADGVSVKGGTVPIDGSFTATIEDEDASVEYVAQATSKKVTLSEEPEFSITVTNNGANGTVTVSGDGTVTTKGTGEETNAVNFESGENEIEANTTVGSLTLSTVAGPAELDGTATLASHSGVSDANSVKVGTLTVTGITTADSTLVSDANSATGGTVTAEGIGTVNGVEFEAASGTGATGATVAADGTVEDLAVGSVIDGVLKDATVTTVKPEVDSKFSVNGVELVSAGTTALEMAATEDSVALTAGDVTVTDSLTVGTASAVVVEVEGGDGVKVTGHTTGTSATISDLENGETVTVGNIKYSAANDIITITNLNDKTDVKYYEADGEGGIGAGVISLNGSTTPTTADNLSPLTGKPIYVSEITDKQYFTTLGVSLKEDGDNVACVVEGDSTPKKVEVRSTMNDGILILKDSTATVEDKGTGTVYNVTDSSSFTAKGVTFTTTEGVISDASGTITLDKATDDLTVSGTVNVNAAAVTTGTLTYQAGAEVSDSKVTTAGGYFTFSEKNDAEDAEDTAINLADMTVTGIDGDATVTINGDVEFASFQTTGSGTFTYGKTAYVVAEDSDGVEFTLNDGEITEVAGLDQDATLTISTKLSDVDLTVNTVEFQDIAAKSGAVFTGTKANKQDATITLFAKGDSVYDGTNTYEIESMGGSDGVVVGANTLAALNEGDKVKVYAGEASAYKEGTTKYYEYEVGANNTMVVTYYDGKAYSSTTYTLSDTEDPGFTVGNAINGKTINGDAGVDSEKVTFGTAAGSTLTATSLTDGVFVNADGSLTTSESKAVAKLSVNDDVVTYASQSSKAQVVSVASGAENWDITTGAGRDTISYAGNGDASVNGGAGDDDITLSGKGDIVANTGDGKNKVTLSGTGDVTLTLGAGKDTVTDSGSTGDLAITASGGNNKIDLSGKTKGDVTVTGGSGNDTITATGADDVISGGDGDDVFVVGNGITISDYSFDNDVIDASAGFGGVTDEGKVMVGGKAADISATAGDFYTARINTGATGVSNKKPENYAWAKDGGSVIDITTYTKDVNLIGDADGASALYAGSGDDYISARADGDSVYGGAGKNTISLTKGGEKRVVGMSASANSKDWVTNYNASFEDEGDSIFMVDGNISDTAVSVATVSSSVANVTLKNGGSAVTLAGAGVNTVTGAVEIKAGETKFAAIASGKTATVESASYADAYIGDDSAVNFSKVDSDLYVDLSNGLTASGNGPKFEGVHSVVGGTSANTMLGSAKADYIVAGTGKSSLYGGAGSDTLIGNGEADMFFFGEGTNTNTIQNFMTADKDDADTVKILGDVTTAKLSGSTIELGTTDGSKAVITKLATGAINANTMVNIESNNFTGIAKLGDSSKANNFGYDASVNFYGGGSASDKVSVATGFANNAEVWLDGSKGTAYASIDVVDFSNGTGNYVLAGDSSKQTIVGGKGDNMLWGGTGASADSIKGGAGKNDFYYGLAEGNDTISSSSANDNVNLYNVSLSDITDGEITNTGVWLSFSDGSKLTVATSKDIKFTMSDGSSYTAEHSSKSWK